MAARSRVGNSGTACLMLLARCSRSSNQGVAVLGSKGSTAWCPASNANSRAAGLQERRDPGGFPASSVWLSRLFQANDDSKKPIAKAKY